MSQRLVEEKDIRDPELHELVILILAVILVELYFCSPGISYYYYYKGKLKFQFLPSFTIFANLVNCILWVILGANRDKLDIQMLVTNTLGFTISLIWIIIYWLILSKNNITGSLIYLFAFFNVLFQVFFVLYTLLPKGGQMAIAINIIMYISTAQNMWDAIKYKQAFLLPSFGCFCGLICSCGFATYGALVGDWDTMKSNTASVAILIPIVSVWAILKCKYNSDSIDPIDLKSNDTTLIDKIYL